MANQEVNNIKLGGFIFSGLFVLMLTFYMIGNGHSFFGASFRLKALFTRLNGLSEGDNVLFSGIQAGTVSHIEIINDTTIEVVLLINNKVKPFIHKNAIVSIGTDGLMGNKVVNIRQGVGFSGKIKDGDFLASKKLIDIDEMLATFSETNTNAAVISETLKNTLLKINQSSVLNILNDKELAVLLKSSLQNINRTTMNANRFTVKLNYMMNNTMQGKGTAGMLFTDTAFASEVKETLKKIHGASNRADQASEQLDKFITAIDRELEYGHGTLGLLLRDTAIAQNLARTMENVEKGTNGFSQNMEALKHNFLFRGYFNQLEKKKKRLIKKNQKTGQFGGDN